MNLGKRYPAGRYDFDAFDRHFCLKPPLLLILALILLCRDFFLPIIVAVSSIKGKAGGGVDLGYMLDDPTAPVRFFASVPALLVLIAMLWRTPSAGRLVRALWRYGSWLVAASALLNVIWSGVRIGLWSGQVRPDSGGALALMGIDLLIVVYVLTARRVRDCFSDFPEPDASRAAAPGKAQAKPPG